MTEQLSPIDRYREQWAPNRERIAQLRADFDNAMNSGNRLEALAISELLFNEALPPSHLPIKNLEKIDDPS